MLRCNKALLLVIVTLLSGCSSANMISQDYSDANKREEMEWDRLTPIVVRDCGHGRSAFEVKPRKAGRYIDCLNFYTRQRVLPVAVYPDILEKVMHTNTELAELYAKNKLNRNEWKKTLSDVATIYELLKQKRTEQAMDIANVQQQKNEQRWKAALVGGLGGLANGLQSNMQRQDVMSEWLSRTGSSNPMSAAEIISRRNYGGFGYPGNCYNASDVAADGSRCGGRAATMRPGGY